MESILNEYQTLQLFGVVECKCNDSKQLQFISSIDKNKDMKCNNCKQKYSSIFKCDICLMSICSKCQTFTAEMQCLRAVMSNFIYAQDYQLQQTRLIGAVANTNNVNSLNMMNNLSGRAHVNKLISNMTSQLITGLNISSLMYGGSETGFDDYFDDGFNGTATQLNGKLNNIIDNLHLKASDKLEYILEEDLMHITCDKIESEICYAILDYLDDVDFCCIIDSRSILKLLEIYWQFYQYHITEYENKWKKLRLLLSKNWHNDNFLTIEEIIDNNSIYKGYIENYYLRDKDGNELIKPKLLYDVNGNALDTVYSNDIDKYSDDDNITDYEDKSDDDEDDDDDDNDYDEND